MEIDALHVWLTRVVCNQVKFKKACNAVKLAINCVLLLVSARCGMSYNHSFQRSFEL